MAGETRIPRARENDYTLAAATQRREFVKQVTGAALDHVGHFSVDPAVLPGNIEHFTGVAQVPIGLAGPLLVNGEYARGEFIVPLATTEGTLVASYNRGMKLLRAAGGVSTTVCDDAMQRAPVFMFTSAREARAFGEWIKEHFAEIKAVAETTTRSGKLRDIEQYAASRFRYLRFNYTTGDAAGQNMVGKATFAACTWIRAQYPGTIEHYLLEANFATDKKPSRINVLRTRGKRVVAEATLPAQLVREIMNTDVETLFRARLVSQLGGFQSGVNNNGAHSANAITAMFIAAALAAEQADEAGLSRLTDIIGAVETARGADAAVDRVVDFFGVLAELSGNRVLMLAMQPVTRLLAPSLRRMIDRVPQGRTRILVAQRCIVEAIRERKPAEAESWMSRHVQDFRRGYELAGIALDTRVGTSTITGDGA